MNKKSKKKLQIETENRLVFAFLNSGFAPYIVPAAYFIVYGFIIMTNHPIGDYGVENDFYRSYVPQAQRLLHGELIIDMYRGPLYQIVLAVTGFLFGQDFFSAGKFINVLFASVSLISVFKLVSVIINKTAAFFTTMLVAVNLQFMLFTFKSGTDMLFIALYFSAIYYLIRQSDFNSRDLLTAGILTGLAYLTRYTALSLLISALIIFAMKYSVNRKSQGNSGSVSVLKPVLSFCLPVLTTAIVWGLICMSRTGSFFYNFNFLNTASSVYKPENVSNDEWTSKFEPGFKSMADVISQDFGMFFNKIFIENFTSFFLNDMHMLMPVFMGILTCAGLTIFLLKFRSNAISLRFLFLISLFFYLQIIFTFYAERHSLPLLMFYSVLVVNIFYYGFMQKFNLKLGKIRLFTLILTTLVIINFVMNANSVARRINSVPTGILDISGWVKKNYKEDLTGKTIMGRAPHIAYYMDMNFEVIPYSVDYDEFIKNVKDKNIEYLYINQWELQTFDKSLIDRLLNYKNPPGDLETIAYTLNPTAVMYKVLK